MTDRAAHRLEAVIGSLSQGVVSVDDGADQATVNPAAARLLGLRAGEIPRADFHAAVATLADRALNQSEATATIRRPAADRSTDIDSTWQFAAPPTHVHVTSQAVRLGAYSGRVWVFDDVSAAAQALQDSQATQDVLRASADAMLNPQGLLEAVRGPDGELVDLRYRSANWAMYTGLGMKAGTLVGVRLLETAPELERSGLLARYARCLETGEPVVLHDFHYPGYDRRYDIQATRAGRDLLALTWSDVTERFRAAQRLAESELHYRLIAENSGDAIVHSRDGRFVWVSPSIEAVLGAPPHHWLGRELRDVVPPEEWAAHDASRKAVAEGHPIQVRIQLIGADGTRHWVDVHSKPFYDAHGQPDGTSSALRLVDDQVAAEQERNEARRQQARSDARFRRSMDNAAIGMCIVAPDGRFLEVNSALCDFLGYDAATLTQKTWQEVTAPEFLATDLRNVTDLLAGRIDSYRMLKQYITAEGRRVWGDLSVSCVRDDDGAVEVCVSQIVDVTSAIEAMHRYRLLAENASDMVAQLRNGRFVWVSPSARDILGAPPEYWIGREVREVVPDDAVSTFDEAREILASGKVFRRNVPVVSVDGVIHWVDLHAKPFHDADGEQDGFTASLRLIDDEMAAHKAAEEARRQEAIADARYRRSMDTAAIGMCLLGADGTFLEVNPALCDMLGYDAATLTTMTWQQVTPPEWLSLGEEEREAVFDGLRNSYRLVKQYIRADGRRIWVSLSVNAVRDEHGRVEALASQMIDITAEVEAREELERSDERNRALALQLQEQTERLEAELRSAADYLASIMPVGLSGRVDVVSRYLPSRELGGDCFDYTWIDDDHLLVYLIDVSGHGIEPALLSVSVHNLLRSGSMGMETLLAPDAALNALNRMFQMEKQGNHYFTIWYAVYQASTRTLRYASAGAPPAFAFEPRAQGGYGVVELSTPATPIGMFPDSRFTSGSYPVPAGCRLLIFSDGAHELALHEGRQMTLADFKDLATRRATSARWWIDDLVDELMALTPARVFHDDCSLIQLTFD